MSVGQTSRPGGSVVAPSIYRDLWEASLDAFFLLHCVRDSGGHITDFVFADMDPRAAALGLAKQAAISPTLDGDTAHRTGFERARRREAQPAPSSPDEVSSD